MKGRTAGLAVFLVVWVAGRAVAAVPPQEPTSQTDRAGRLRAAMKDAAADFWIYDDLEAGDVEARRMGRPLLVSLRCVP